MPVSQFRFDNYISKNMYIVCIQSIDVYAGFVPT